MIYPSNSQEIKEQARYKIRLEQHAKDAGQTIEEYIRDSRYNYVTSRSIGQMNTTLCRLMGARTKPIG